MITNNLKSWTNRVNENAQPAHKPLRSIKVTYSDGSVIDTNMAAHLTDAQMLDYFKVGKRFNLGNGPEDKIATVVSAEITDGQSVTEALNKLNIGPINFPEFTGTGRYILGSDKFYAVYVMASSNDANDKYKTMSRDPQDMLDMVHFILGGYHGDAESTANELAGYFVNKEDAQAFYDKLDYRPEV